MRAKAKGDWLHKESNVRLCTDESGSAANKACTVRLVPQNHSEEARSCMSCTYEA